MYNNFYDFVNAGPFQQQVPVPIFQYQHPSPPMFDPFMMDSDEEGGSFFPRAASSYTSSSPKSRSKKSSASRSAAAATKGRGSKTQKSSPTAKSFFQEFGDKNNKKNGYGTMFGYMDNSGNSRKMAAGMTYRKGNSVGMATATSYTTSSPFMGASPSFLHQPPPMMGFPTFNGSYAGNNDYYNNDNESNSYYVESPSEDDEKYDEDTTRRGRRRRQGTTSKKSSPKKLAAEAAKEISRTKKCFVCKFNAIDTVNYKCGHMTFCYFCAIGESNCPLCISQKKFSHGIRIFIEGVGDNIDTNTTIARYILRYQKDGKTPLVRMKPKGLGRMNESKVNKHFLNLKCICCRDKKINSIFCPCGHMSMCTKCSREVVRCPVCRVEIDDIFYM